MKPEKLDEASNIFEFEKLVKDLKTKEIELAWRLYCIRETKSFEGRYSSFGEMLDTLQIRHDTASRMCTVIEEYVIHRNVATSQIAGISFNWLYEARKLLPLHDPEKVLAMARMNTLQELRLNLGEIKAGEHEHEWVEFHFRKCGKCKLSEGL